MRNEGRLLHVVEVHVAGSDNVERDGGGGDGANEDQLLVSRADDARVEESLDRLLEACGRTVVQPVGAVEDGAAVPALRLLELRSDSGTAQVPGDLGRGRGRSGVGVRLG